MKLLRDLLFGTRLLELRGNAVLAISKVCSDNRQVQAEALFVALRGQNVDGHDFAADAVRRGAKALLVERFIEDIPAEIVQVRVEDTSLALGICASNFYEDPSSKLKIVAVTGTNGKTTTATLLHELALSLGLKAGLISTVVNKVIREEIASTHTTPDPIALQALLHQMAEAGCTHAFMEASSHGLAQGRLSGVRFAGAVFTNISRDHLDFHGSMDRYIAAKKLLFDGLSSAAFALVNLDDKHGKTMVQNCKAKLRSFALKTEADFKGRVLESDFDGMLLDFEGEEFWTRLIGRFNASNLLAIYGAARLLELAPPHELHSAMSLLKPVAGRFQYVRSKKGITGIVDYAHTPDALDNVIQTIHQVSDKGSRLLVVLGCGGDRDRGKRPEMARIAVRNSDRAVFTSDNPRSEDPEVILNDMDEGLDLAEKSRRLRISDRLEAIRTAVALALPGDVLLVAGKGHETYQEIKGVRHPFDDLDVLRTLFQDL